ncbi:hypothetical protein OF377_00925 [Ureaplasma sp. ES3154-GEN]|uniref:Vmc-like lipoprotein signal peptide domain-containing protein n=1 Tax=Ureaplasma sp. ES3154-GEN TaxID=2984844 RepID=UPI0021E779B4|nr:hypothetical protein [Ureaplasma sp. ES3154-GEN]MCV3743451.1 hypothetical protein [Ureaplasma sp. ES3154-GEN]
MKKKHLLISTIAGITALAGVAAVASSCSQKNKNKENFFKIKVEINNFYMSLTPAQKTVFDNKYRAMIADIEKAYNEAKNKADFTKIDVKFNQLLTDIKHDPLFESSSTNSTENTNQSNTKTDPIVTRPEFIKTKRTPEEIIGNGQIATLVLNDDAILNNFLKQANTVRSVTPTYVEPTFDLKNIKNQQTENNNAFGIDGKNIFSFQQNEISSLDFYSFIHNFQINDLGLIANLALMDAKTENDKVVSTAVPFNTLSASNVSSYDRNGFLDYDIQHGQLRWFSLIRDPKNSNSTYQTQTTILKGFKADISKVFIFDEKTIAWANKETKSQNLMVEFSKKDSDQKISVETEFQYIEDPRANLILAKISLNEASGGEYTISKIYAKDAPDTNLYNAAEDQQANLHKFIVYKDNQTIEPNANININLFLTPQGQQIRPMFGIGNIEIDNVLRQKMQDDEAFAKTNKESMILFSKPLANISLNNLDETFFPVLLTTDELANYNYQYVVTKDSEVNNQLIFKVKYINKTTNKETLSENELKIRYTSLYDAENITSVKVEMDGFKKDSEAYTQYVNDNKDKDLKAMDYDDLMDLINQAYTIYYSGIDLENNTVYTKAEVLDDKTIQLSFYTTYQQTTSEIKTSTTPNILLGTATIDIFKSSN